jgi:hypothetical protein
MKLSQIELTTPDVVLMAPFFLLVPFLVNRYFRGLRFSWEYRLTIVVGGWAWLMFSYASISFMYWIGTPPYDQIVHHGYAQIIAKKIQIGQWNYVWEHLGYGNKLYQVFTGTIMYYTGTTVYFVLMLNAFFAFWGNLVLVSHFRRLYPYGSQTPIWAIALMFFPSVVFWTTGNSKEALMYWAICNVFTFFFRQEPLRAFQLQPLPAIGLAVGVGFRPHAMACWLGSALLVSMLQRGRKISALLVVIFFALAMVGTQKQSGVTPTVSDAYQYAEDLSVMMQKDKTQGSTIDYGEEPPPFLISGLVSIFFRPFPWKIRNARTAMNAVETWVLTLAIFASWVMARHRFREIIRQPEIRLSLLVVLAFGAFVSFLPNEGLIVRQKVQIIPALLTLAVLPMFQLASYKRSVLLSKWKEARARAAGLYSSDPRASY